MFRSAFSRISANNLFRNVIQRSRFSSEANFIRNPREINEVTLVGTLRFDPIAMESGSKQILVQSNGQTYTVHVKYADGYTAGQRVLVKGKLYTKQFITSENKNVKRVTVKGIAHPIDEEVNQNSSGDIASIQILANVCSDGIHKDDHSMLNIASHYIENKDAEKKSQFHTIVIYDKNLREYARDHVKKNDRVYISGSIKHQTHTDLEGKRLFAGVLLANSIQKVAKRQDKSEEIGEKEQNA